MDWLALTWLGIIGFTLLLYIVLDGFTLGIGILLPFLTPDERDIAISSILPTWDGNQTWLVFSLAAFYGMFPIGFAYLFPKIYLPALLLALMLLFRGICFEFRLKSDTGVVNWDRLFSFSSTVIAFIHGYLVGQLIIGYGDDDYQSGLFFKIITGLVLMSGYMLLGSTRLILKSENKLLLKARKISLCLVVILLVGMLIIGILTFVLHSIPHWNSIKFVLLALLLSLTLIGFVLLPQAIHAKKHFYAYWLTVSIFVFTYFSLLIYIFPYIVPYQMTYYEARSSNVTLSFTIIAAVFMIPLLLLYTGYAYYVFRGKTKEKLHY